MTVDDILMLFERAGHSQYGAEAGDAARARPATGGALAVAEDAEPELVAAELVLYVGNLLISLRAEAPERGIDYHNENSAAHRPRLGCFRRASQSRSDFMWRRSDT